MMKQLRERLQETINSLNKEIMERKQEYKDVGDMVMLNLTTQKQTLEDVMKLIGDGK